MTSISSHHNRQFEECCSLLKKRNFDLCQEKLEENLPTTTSVVERANYLFLISFIHYQNLDINGSFSRNIEISSLGGFDEPDMFSPEQLLTKCGYHKKDFDRYEEFLFRDNRRLALAELHSANYNLTKGRVEESVNQVNSCIFLDKTLERTAIELLLKWGISFYNKGECHSALSLFEDAHELSELVDMQQQCLYGKGMCYFLNRSIPSAINSFQEALTLDQNNPLAPRIIIYLNICYNQWELLSGG